MGTVMNGNVWSGACVNDKVVSGLVKNGVAFYKKATPIPSIYKRRIMVDDNLKGKKVFFENYPGNLYELMYQTGGDGTTSIIELNNGDYAIYQNINVEGNYPNYILTSGNIDFSEVVSDSNYKIYSFNCKTTPVTFEINSPQIVNDDGDYLVTNIDDTMTAYRCLYIEDTNIRPVQVGDIITEDTIFYFNAPDDFYLQEPVPGVAGKNVDVISLNNGQHNFMLRSWDDQLYAAFYINGTRSEEGNIYDYNRETDTLSKNVSKVVGAYRLYQHQRFTGTVTSIEESSTIYPYILIDATTLGA